MMLGADWLSWPDWTTITRRVDEADEAARIFLRCLIQTKSYNRMCSSFFFAHLTVSAQTVCFIDLGLTCRCVCTHVWGVQVGRRFWWD